MKTIELIKKVLGYFNLESETDDFDNIHETITKNVVFKGTNLWILIFAIIIASVGLNMNSTAVIIGAMLISPLMGPINGMGYSIATYNFPLFKSALKNFLFAVIASLIASTLYFILSPISTAHSELLARTSPTIYDVLIALFGGMAGIVAISSKQKGNVIPGVAIATALMPPLCTAGYGLATGHFYYFFGAFYLFAINTVFIALASIAISQLLKFPIRTVVEPSQKKKINTWISVVTTMILLPSIYFGYLLVQKDKFTEKANKFVQRIGIVEENYLLKSQIDASKRTITLVYGGASMTDEQKGNIKKMATDFSIPDANIIFEQGLSFEVLKSRNTEVDNLKAERNKLTHLLQKKEAQADSISNKKLEGREILSEIRSLYPQIKTCSYAETYLFRDTSATPTNMKIVVFTTEKKQILTKTDKAKVGRWLITKLKTDNIKIIYEN